ncbi:MAG: efflux RND transporter periplasmic adaptor subunit [Hyphomicrobiaceae bacterium]
MLAVAPILVTTIVIAHEGHDHDKPAPLNLPIAPRVVAITPDYELVGVLSGEQRLTIFLHRFATGEPVKGGKISVSGGAQAVDAAVKEDGLFELVAPWLATPGPIDLIFSLTLPDDQDVLTGRLEKAASAGPATELVPANLLLQNHVLLIALGSLVAGVLVTLLLNGSLARRRTLTLTQQELAAEHAEPVAEDVPKVKHLRRLSTAILAALLVGILLWPLGAWSQPKANLPSVPATMATDVPQRMADGSLFVPKATQHLLTVRTVLAEETKAPRTAQLIGTIIADPNSFGRVQVSRPGRIEAPPAGLAHVGKRVEKGELLGYLVPYIEAADKANIESQIAEAEARIAKQTTILKRYNERPGAVPQVKVDEVEGEINALRRKRAELQPSLVVREEIRAPLGGIISVANVAPGQIIESRDVVFEIVDPNHFWVEAIAHDASVVTGLSKAYAVLNTGEQLSLELGGVGLSLKQQATPITFKVVQGPPNLSVGRPVTVILQSTAEVSGILLPAASVVRASSGLAMVWVKTDAERFEPHTIRYEALDGQRVVVTAGLKPELRVVTEGATILSQVR